MGLMQQQTLGVGQGIGEAVCLQGAVERARFRLRGLIRVAWAMAWAAVACTLGARDSSWGCCVD